MGSYGQYAWGVIISLSSNFLQATYNILLTFKMKTCLLTSLLCMFLVVQYTFAGPVDVDVVDVEVDRAVMRQERAVYQDCNDDGECTIRASETYCTCVDRYGSYQCSEEECARFTCLQCIGK